MFDIGLSRQVGVADYSDGLRQMICLEPAYMHSISAPDRHCGVATQCTIRAQPPLTCQNP